MPWGPGAAPDWSQWYGGAAGGGPEAQAWMNVQLPWYQQAQQAQQFAAQIAMQQWAQQGAWGEGRWQQEQQAALARQQQEQQLAYQRWATGGGWEQEAGRQQQQLDYQRWATGGGWEQQAALQTQRLGQEEELTRAGWGQQAALQTQRLEQEQMLQEQQITAGREQSAMQAFGRRWQPNVRWM